MKHHQEKALFMIVLILTMPLYSASALAAVQITQNSGNDNINGFLNADGDTWHVEALVTNAAAVSPEEIVLDTGGSQFPFNSCSSSSLGQTCQYNENFLDGVIERAYPFSVRYTAPGASPISANAVITADGRAPIITGMQARQQGSTVHIDFIVEDTMVGLQVVEIIDADTNQVVQTIPEVLGETRYGYVRDGTYNGILQAALTGEGIQRFKIRAEDRLIHSAVSSTFSFRKDFLAPEVVAGSLKFGMTGDYSSTTQTITDISVDVLETNLDIGGVTASSDQALFLNNVAHCVEDAAEPKLNHCTWNDVQLSPATTVSFKVQATDEFGNTAEQEVSRTLQLDTTAPVIEFFGTERVFEDQSYIKQNDNVLVLRVRDSESGVTKENILANLGALGRVGSVSPDECAGTDALECRWTGLTVSGTGTVRVSLTKLQDAVGNEGSLPELELQVDNDAPVVQKLELTGVSALGEHDYFQSNDLLKLKMTVQETSGLYVLVNLNNVAMDAAEKYPETEITRGLGAGWQVFTQENCKPPEAEPESDVQNCEFITDGVKTAADSAMKLEIKVQDTAGNEATVWPARPDNVQGANGKYTLNLLGLDDAENPNYWEIKTKKSLLNFVDLDVTQLSYTRMPVEVTFKSSPGSQAEVLSATLSSTCDAQGEAPDLSRVLLYGGISAAGSKNPVLKIMLEFAPFDGRTLFGITDKKKFEQATVNYNCTVHLFSKIGNKALSHVEEQTVPVEVHFAFSSLGALDENIGQRVRDLKEGDLFRVSEALTTLNNIFQWLNFLGKIVGAINSVLGIVSLVSNTYIGFADTAEATGIAAPVGAALRGACLQLSVGEEASWKYLEYLQVPLDILSCNPDPTHLGVYGEYQKAVLDLYNLLSGRGLLGIPAASVYDNLYASVMSFCVPGIIYNLEKAREITCRKIICYGRDVPAGVATITSCNQLYDLEMCRYFYGPFFDMVGFGVIKEMFRLIKQIFSSPVGLIRLGELVSCALLCFVKGGTTIKQICEVSKGFDAVLSILDNIVGAFTNRPDVTASPYCSQAEQIKIDELTTVKKEEPVTEA